MKSSGRNIHSDILLWPTPPGAVIINIIHMPNNVDAIYGVRKKIIQISFSSEAMISNQDFVQTINMNKLFFKTNLDYSFMSVGP
jgi:hypothetical protein